MTDKEKKKQLKFLARVELCRKDFWYYCHCILPTAYPENNKYLKEWCHHLQTFYENGEVQDVLVLNAPPRHKKSLTLQLFSSWLIGRSSLEKKYKRIVVACYNQTLSIKFSTNVKNFMRARQAGNFKDICFLDVFPNCYIAKGFDTKEEWRINGAPESSFLTTSPSSSVTGFGCDILIIDDMYNKITELYSKPYSEALDTFVFNTLTTRFENEKKMIVSMTRWGKEDICQKIMDSKKPEKVHFYKYKVKDENDNMLDENILSLEEFYNIQKTMTADAFLANYQQEFIAREGALYKNIKTYSSKDLPEKDEEGRIYKWPVYCVIDTANKGTDYTCAIFYTVYDDRYFIKDIYYTQKQMSETEEEFARLILQNDCCYLLGEGNNGGDIYIRNVEKIYEKLGGKNCIFKTFTQKLNKESRILSQVSFVEKFIFLPEKWHIYWPEFYVHLSDFQSDFKKNAHDDCADAITIIADCYNKEGKRKVARISNYY